VVTITFNGEPHIVHHLPVTLRNAGLVKDALQRVNDVVAQGRNDVQLAGIKSVLRILPELAAYVDGNGSYKATAITNRIAYYRSLHEMNRPDDHTTEPEPFDEDAAREQARAWVQERVTSVIMSSPDAVQLLNFTTDAYPTSIGALSAGIEIIKETVDRAKTHVDTLALIDAPIDADHWQTVDATEVAAYCDAFRQAFK